jgi:hypothetical protein
MLLLLLYFVNLKLSLSTLNLRKYDEKHKSQLPGTVTNTFLLQVKLLNA